MILDLRDYVTTTAGRDLLIDRCETTLFPAQAQLGATFPGLFRDADDPCRFVWLRGMPDLATRARVLTAFYVDGALWKAQRAEVNRWIVDSDDVLLVRPTTGWAAPAAGPSVVGMYTHLRPTAVRDDEAAALDRSVADAIRAASGRVLVTLATDPTPNNFPRHPIRTGPGPEGIHGRVWFATFPPLDRSGLVSPSVPSVALDLPDLTARRLVPTATSILR
ncbi:MAG: hypothetical protein ABMB14_16610 [Myxococcota bacterium]